MMQNEEIAKVLDQVGDMLEIGGENFFRVRAYRNAARSVREQPVPVAELSFEQLDEIPGIGADLAGKISTLVKTGELPLHRELSSKFPPALLELTDIAGLGPKRLKLLIDHLHIEGKDDLEREARPGAFANLRASAPRSRRRFSNRWRAGRMRPSGFPRGTRNARCSR